MANKLGTLERLYVKRMTNMLADKGKQIATKAAADDSKESKNITLNQVDAYGVVVYYNGKVQRTLIGGDIGKNASRYRSPEPNNISEDMTRKNKRWAKAGVVGDKHKGWAAAGIPDGTGYEWARMFVKELGKTGAIPQRGFAMVVFNAAYYSHFQEHQEGNLKRKYRVISQIYGDLEDAGKDYEGAVVKGFNLP